MMSPQKTGLFLIGVILLFPISSVYGHGLGIDTIRSADVGGKEITISVELPCLLYTSDAADE